jgi:uncharacterized protein YecA (UPF0149 family)
MEKINSKNAEKLEGFKGILENEDFGRMWMKMHTPWVRRTKKVGRNELCPCGSGKKFKNCECYAKRFTAMYTLDEKHTKGWR